MSKEGAFKQGPRYYRIPSPFNTDGGDTFVRIDGTTRTTFRSLHWGGGSRAIEFNTQHCGPTDSLVEAPRSEYVCTAERFHAAVGEAVRFMLEKTATPGVVPPPPPTELRLPATEVKAYFMFGNHTFARIEGNTIDALLDGAEVFARSERGQFGMLCPVLVMSGNTELRRVGQGVHCSSADNPGQAWYLGKRKWREALEADADVRRLLNPTEIPSDRDLLE